ncbi:MAG: hypothetical protein E6G57_00065 [Actinobacteria bacterium]|nr:MAG: hypothetical protein E6G57_00065 [Actinomycetota bacterium]
MAANPLLHEEHLAARSPGRELDVWNTDAGLGGDDSHERLVLGRPLPGHERQLILEAAEGDEPPQAHEQIGTALLAAQHLDEQLLAGVGGDEESGVATATNAHGHEARDFDAGDGQSIVHLGQGGVAARRAQCQVQRGTHRPPDGDARDHVEG